MLEIEKLLKNPKAASWSALGRRGGRQALELTLHLKPAAIGACVWELLEELVAEDAEEEQEERMETVRLWTTKPDNFDKVRVEIRRMGIDAQRPHNLIPAERAKKYCECGKLVTLKAGATVLAYCNYFERNEEEKARARGLFETIMNDAIRRLKGQIEVTVQYTSRNTIREAALAHDYCCLADMQSWFDQLAVRGVTDLTAVEDDEGGIHAHMMTAMGSIPSCRTAHTTLGILAHQPAPQRQPVTTAKFVDNVGFFGSRDASTNSMKLFKTRCARVGALINHENNDPQQLFDFLGERYDLQQKTRCLTSRVVEKVAFVETTVQALLNRDTKSANVSVRRILAWVGTLRYAAEVLDLQLYHYIAALKTQVEAARQGTIMGFDTKFCCPREALEQVYTWAATARNNKEVHVVHGARVHPPQSGPPTPETRIYVDASAWGWGAVIVAGAVVRHIAQAWTPDDRANHNVQSSVVAEPLALCRLLCSLRRDELQNTRIFSDHKSLVEVAKGSYSLIDGYNRAIALVDELKRSGLHITIDFVAGNANPADALSRGAVPPPPVLHVTHIGGKRTATEVPPSTPAPKKQKNDEGR